MELRKMIQVTNIFNPWIKLNSDTEIQTLFLKKSEIHFD